MRDTETVLIASWLEPELVQRIRGVDERITVLYEPDLLRPPRYPADHKGTPVDRSPDQEREWDALLARATILFDFDQTRLANLAECAPRLHWVQSTSAGVGQFVRRMGYAESMPGVRITTASGVHAIPLAEFAVLGMLMHSRRIPHMVRAQRDKHWERFAGSDLEGKTALVFGLGRVGEEIARLSRALRMRVIGVKRRPRPDALTSAHEVHGPDRLQDLLPTADFLVLAAPHTDETERVIGARELAALPNGAVVVNVGRGSLVDEAALVEALSSGRLGGAYLDVFEEEPLPPSSPLWEMPNVLVSPHSGSTSERENERITDLFCDNLRRHLDGEPLENVLDVEALY